jgi:signal transduction histidine kinase
LLLGGFGTGGIDQILPADDGARVANRLNVRVDSDDRRRALVEAGIAITSELSLDAILQTLARIAAELTDARYSALGVIDRGGTGLERFVTFGIDDETRAAIGEPPRGRGILGVLIHDARPLRLDDLSQDPRSVGFPPNHPPMHSFLGVPVMTRGVAFGNLYLAEKRSQEPFTEEDEEIVTLLAAQAAVAIENAGSVQRDALRRAVQAQEVERRRLARELHDETGQALTSILLGLAAVERAESAEAAHVAAAELRQLVVETLQDVRRLAVELRPSALDDFGLEPALRRLGQSVREAAHLDVQVEARLGSQRLPADVETALYRIVQEALTNVVKHAGAQHVSIVVTRKPASVLVMIEDDGRGFDPARTRADGLGLTGMTERVELLDGSFQIDAGPGAGTTLIVELPLL